MIHDVYKILSQEVKDPEGNTQEVDVEELIGEDVETDIYIEIQDIAVILPFYTKDGIHLTDRSVVKANGDNYIVKGTLEHIMGLKNNKAKVGFKR
jgi:hypothetical protein